MTMNGMKVNPFDPFLLDAGSQRMLGDPMTYDDNRVRIQGFTLPYEPKLTAEERQNWRSKGWRDAQGFYIYRANRLLTAGGWMGMFGNTSMGESTKHARVRVEIVNSCDSDWKIDILKTEATPPDELREGLKTIAKQARFKSEEMYRQRVRGGKRDGRGPKNEEPPLWSVSRTSEGSLRLQIQSSHSMVQLVEEKVGKSLAAVLLRALEVEFPIHEIIALYERDPDNLMREDNLEPPEGLVEMGLLMIQKLHTSGMAREDAFQTVMGMTPFNQYQGKLAPELQKKP